MKAVKESKSLYAAIEKATQYAREGPRVSAVLTAGSPRPKYIAVEGFLDFDGDELKQIMLITPDGRQWTEGVEVKPRRKG